MDDMTRKEGRMEGRMEAAMEARRASDRSPRSGQTRNHFGAERIVRPEISRAGADMNVTPLIDILLVLLVIFMAALPATQKGLDVNLPAATEEGTPAHDGKQIVVTVDADRRLTVNSREVSSDELQRFLHELFRPRRDKTLYIIGAGTLRYGEIVKIIDAARGAGVLQVGIVTDSMRQSRS